MPKKETQNTGQEPEKIVTKYDLKMQRRKEEKEKAAREEKVSRIIGILVVVALACIVLSFPIRSYLTVNGTYVTVDGEKISRVEFDFNYQIARNSYLNQYGAYLSYFGLDMSGDIDSQMYSDTLTWGDYFDELAVQNIARSKGLKKEAQAENFAYDVTEDYREFQEALKEAASDAGSTVKNYLKELYGPYATESRVKPCLEENFYVSAYNEVIADRLTPSQEEIRSYYEENKASYDSVDYYSKTVDAELPTEPTELADPVEPEEGEEEGTEGADEEEEAYEPSEAEIAAAMEKAKAEADSLEDTIMTEGELTVNAKQTAVSSQISSWLFDEERKQGDTTVIEDATNHRYYVVGFESRYLDETPSVDVRATLTTEDNGQDILDEWKGGAATEESFAEICDKYNDPEITSVEGGLLEGVLISDMPQELADWMGDSARAVGDTAVISPESEEYTYVVYYAGTNDAGWIQSIRTTLRNEKVSEYMETFTENIDVQDPRDNLRYLDVRAAEEAAASSEAAAEGSEGTDSSEADSESSEGADSSEADSESSEGADSSEADSESSEGADSSEADSESSEGADSSEADSEGSEGTDSSEADSEGADASDG